MGIEIERKFLVVGEAWRDEVTVRERLRDGLISYASGGKVRVRIGDRYWQNNAARVPVEGTFVS